MTNRTKWQHEEPSLIPGDLVILKEQFQKRSDWPMAIIVDTKRGRDDRVRIVTLKTVDGKVITRGLDHIYPLETKRARTEHAYTHKNRTT